MVTRLFMLRAWTRAAIGVDATAGRQPRRLLGASGLRRAKRQLLSELGGAWDLPPKANEDFTSMPDSIRCVLKARLLIEKFDSVGVWGWKDPRNSLTLPFWEEVLPGSKRSSSCETHWKSRTP